MRLESGWMVAPDVSGGVAYFARPDVPVERLPCVLVVQEIWGVDDYLIDMVRRLAKAGYYAVAPDLYAEDAHRPAELEATRIATAKAYYDGQPHGAFRHGTQQRAESLAAARRHGGADLATTLEALLPPSRDFDRYAAGISDWISYLHGKGVRRPAAVGFCLGGSVVGRLVTTDPRVSRGISYYGQSPAEEQAGRLSAPLLGFYGAGDTRCNETIPRMVAGAARAGQPYEYYVYAAPHGFGNDTRPTYDVAAARDAWARTLAFLAAGVAEDGLIIASADRPVS